MKLNDDFNWLPLLISFFESMIIFYYILASIINFNLIYLNGFMSFQIFCCNHFLSVKSVSRFDFFVNRIPIYCTHSCTPTTREREREREREAWFIDACKERKAMIAERQKPSVRSKTRQWRSLAAERKHLGNKVSASFGGWRVELISTTYLPYAYLPTFPNTILPWEIFHSAGNIELVFPCSI